MNAQRLLNKLELEADSEWVKNYKRQKLETIQRNVTQPETKVQQDRKKLHQLRSRTAQAEYELKLRAELEQEQQRCFTAERELRAANLTLAERKAQEAETRDFQIRLSRITSPEQHPDWREHCTATFRSRKL